MRDVGGILHPFILKAGSCGMKRKNRMQKHEDYINKFSDIPVDYKERLSWLYDKLKITDRQAFEILHKKQNNRY